jgi:hypothetical protein
MVARSAGLVIFVSSIAGLTTGRKSPRISCTHGSVTHGAASRQEPTVRPERHAIMDNRPTATDATTTPRGRKHSATGELTTIWKVKPGHQKQIREALETLDNWPLAEKAHAGEPIGTLRDRRWVLFDDDSRMLFATNYDGEWVPHIEAFTEHNAAAFEVIFTHIEGWPELGLSDPGVFDYIIEHRLTAIEYMHFYDGTVHEIRKALALQKSFDKLIDSPAFQLAAASSQLRRARAQRRLPRYLLHAVLQRRYRTAHQRWRGSSHGPCG